MNLTRNIVLVGTKDEVNSKFVTHLDPIKIHANEGLALKSIFHGPVFNITKYNNVIYYRTELPMGYSDKNQISLEIKKKLNIPSIHDEFAKQYRYDNFKIEEGFYKTTNDILKLIAKVFVQKFPANRTYTTKPPRFHIDSVRGETHLKISPKDMDILLHDDTPWYLLGVNNSSKLMKNGGILRINAIDYQNSSLPAFVYVNIVENSYLNGRLSRNLTVVPLTLKQSWSYNEFKHPTYVPIEVKQFSNILVELRDLNGNFIMFDPMYKTVITLHIKPIKGLSHC